MAHWIIEKSEHFDTNMYTCSECRKKWNGIVYSPNTWNTCPSCGAIMKEESEATAVEPGPTKDVVILSIEKYDEMRSDLVKLGEDLEAANKDKEHMLALIKNIGLTEDIVKRIIPCTGRFSEDRMNPVTGTMRVYCSFEMER